jgi:hypothetical protein
VGGGQVVDTRSAQEFMQQALEWIAEEELGAIAGELEEKSRRFRTLLGGGGARALDDGGVRRLLRSVFATRRQADRILREVGPDRVRESVAELLDGPGPAEDRFEAFCARPGDLWQAVAQDLASECLHYVRPEECWLWTRWMWDPRTETGALRLVTMDDYDLRCPGPKETYLRVGEAVAFVSSVGRAAGFERIGRGLFGAHVYLACVYGVYLYTVVRMRMTKEFNRAVPALPELSRRLLGVYRMEV